MILFLFRIVFFILFKIQTVKDKPRVMKAAMSILTSLRLSSVDYLHSEHLHTKDAVTVYETLNPKRLRAAPQCKKYLTRHGIGSRRRVKIPGYIQYNHHYNLVKAWSRWPCRSKTADSDLIRILKSESVSKE